MQTDGFVYVHGRSLDSAICVVVNFKKVDLERRRVDDYLNSVVFVLESVLLQHPHDQWVVIADMTGVTITSVPAKVPPT